MLQWEFKGGTFVECNGAQVATLVRRGSDGEPESRRRTGGRLGEDDGGRAGWECRCLSEASRRTHTLASPVLSSASPRRCDRRCRSRRAAGDPRKATYLRPVTALRAMARSHSTIQMDRPAKIHEARSVRTPKRKSGNAGSRGYCCRSIDV